MIFHGTLESVLGAGQLEYPTPSFSYHHYHHLHHYQTSLTCDLTNYLPTPLPACIIVLVMIIITIIIFVMIVIIILAT